MASPSITSLLIRCSISRVSSIYRSRFYSTAPLISRALIAKHLINKPCCAISIRSASSKALTNDNDKIKRADENLLRVLESEIAAEEEVVDDDEADKEGVLPKDFQFEIIDNPASGIITLKREYDGEQIQATVYKIFNVDEGGNNNENDEDESGSEDSNDTQNSNISLVVTINKKAGPTLEFCCTLTPNDLEIESMSLRSSENSDEDYYQGPEFSDLDESLQKAFHKYLAARGLKKSLYDYLNDYMISKDDKEYFAWLKNLKEFIEK